MQGRPRNSKQRLLSTSLVDYKIMNVIYVGAIPPQHLVDEINNLGSYVDFATFTFQNALVSGLDNWFPEMRIITGIRVDNFPKVKKIYFKPEYFSHKNGEKKDDIFIGIVNLPLIKRVALFFDIRRNIKRMLKRDEQNVVIMYSMPSNQLLAVATLRKYLHRTCLVVPDLPEFMSNKGGILRRIGKAIDRKIVDWSVKRIDTFALLSSHMPERLPIDGKKWVQMEGLYHDVFEVVAVEKEVHKVILYTGAMGERYGINDLIKAFLMIDDPDYRLWIRGNGASNDEIRDMEAKDKRIKYIPPMPKKDLIELLQKATVLVNPVPRGQEFTRFFFPSKTMEYLASGTPVVMYHLDCMPKEYDEHIFYVTEESVKGLRDKLVEVCEMDRKELKEKGEKAREFVLTKKNAIVQTKKIVELLID